MSEIQRTGYTEELEAELDRLRGEIAEFNLERKAVARQRDEVTRELLALQRVSNDLLATQHLDQTLSSVLRGLEEGLGFAFGVIFVADQRLGQFFARTSARNPVVQGLRDKAGVSIERVRMAITERNNPVVEAMDSGHLDVEADLSSWLNGGIRPEQHTHVAQFLREAGVRSIACAPMAIRGEVAGIILGASGRENLTSTERETFQNFANQAGMAVENAQLVTDLRRVRDELEQKNKALQSLEHLKEGLVQMVVHDMKNPITSIRGYIELMLDEPAEHVPDDLRKSLKVCYDSSSRLLNMVRDLLDISKMEEGLMRLNREPVHVGHIIRDLQMEYDGMAQRRRKTLLVELDPALEPISADLDLVGRTIANLLSNALKHTPTGSEIALRAVAIPNGVQVSVSDNGDGIPAEFHKKVFEKFGVVEVQHQGARMNTGLGLTFCKMAIEAHHGKIWLESETGKGTTFHFTLPVDIA